jgi:sugar lactone lactonase YvrE
MKPFTAPARNTFFTISAAILLITVILSSCGKTGSSTSPHAGSNPPTPTRPTPVAPPVITQVSPLEGPAATALTITGTGFSDTTANDTVYINGMMAKISQASGTQLVVTVPPLAGSGPVTVHVHGDSVAGPVFTYVYQYVVVTLAGNGEQGNADGTGAAAGFNYPIGIAVDANGNLFVGDQLNEKVRMITSAGVVTTLAGTGAVGSANGPGNSATFYYPTGVTLGPPGIIYVTDLGGNIIRNVGLDGAALTMAGTGATGHTDGPAGSATFSSPTGVVIDKSYNLYIADAGNNKIRMISTSGFVSTFAGSGAQGSADGTGTAASFYYPYGIAIDASGNLYVADARNNKIRKIRDSLLESNHFRRGGRVYPINVAGHLYHSLEKTPFVSLYSTSSWSEDLAEFPTVCDLTQVLKQPFRIMVTNGGKTVVAYSICGSLPSDPLNPQAPLDRVVQSLAYDCPGNHFCTRNQITMFSVPIISVMGHKLDNTDTRIVLSLRKPGLYYRFP